MAINLPEAYSTILDKGFTLKSLTAPAFKGKYKVIGGTTKTFKVYSTEPAQTYDYSERKSVGGSNFGYKYSDANNTEQIVTASQDRAYSAHIDKADAVFSKDGSLDTKEVMRATLEEVIYPEIDKYAIAALAKVGTHTVKAVTEDNIYKEFLGLTTKQTNAKVPATGRVAFVSASAFTLLKLDQRFTPASELTAKSRRSGDYGMVDGVLVISVPDDYMPDKTTIILTHEKAAALPKYLTEHKQGEYADRASGYYVVGRYVFEAFVFNKKKSAVQVLKSA